MTLLRISVDAAEGLYQLAGARYGRQSRYIQLSGFDRLMDKAIASALVDRLVHSAHVVIAEGESVRLAAARFTCGRGPASRSGRCQLDECPEGSLGVERGDGCSSRSLVGAA
jgi:hypothetical protein